MSAEIPSQDDWLEKVAPTTLPLECDERPEDPYYLFLLKRNREWADLQIAKDPLYFTKLQAKQTPRVFWIGCSDSRVMPDALIGAKPGEVFDYRNVANMCLHTGMAFLGALDYAVSHLKVDHIIVCGHYNCGGVKAAMGEPSYGLVDNWIRHIKDVYRFHFRELDGLPSFEQRFRRFVELNVHEQVLNVAKTSVVQSAWEQGRKLSIHGWVFNIYSGEVIDLKHSLSSNATLPRSYDFGSELVDWRFSERIAREVLVFDGAGPTAPPTPGRSPLMTPPLSRVRSEAKFHFAPAPTARSSLDPEQSHSESTRQEIHQFVKYQSTSTPGC